MGYVSVGFYCVEKAFGGEFVPSLYGFGFRQVVEGVVDFDGVEMLCVMLEPFALGQLGGIEQLPPVVVILSRCAYSNIAVRFAHRGYFNILKLKGNGYNLSFNKKNDTWLFKKTR